MPPAIIGAAISAVGTVGSAFISAGAEGRATEAQIAGQERAIGQYQESFGATEESLAPWLQSGAEAAGQYANILGAGTGAPNTEAMYEGLRQYPGYQFALEEGLGAVEQSAAARGTLQSGQTMKDLTAYGQGLATSNFENYMNRLQGLSGVGQQTAVQTGGFRQNMAGQVAAAQRGIGQATATGYQNQAGIWGGAIEGVAGIAGNYIGGLGGGGGASPAPPGTGVNYGYGAASPLNY